ncbi:MAG: glucosamine-6-phosphate deaminase [Kiritimatiellae bacterium]|nr:glucosamine-6-phosphate deaminase [Kiritimatiellia bacterium]MDD5519678.1 glucosamine-6-phosphate deaminase [Kiritimatiellia bacterium]
MKWIKVPDYESMGQTGAKRLFNVIEGAVRTGRRINIGLATGNTMIRPYEILAEMLNTAGFDLSKLYTFNLDEYVGGDGRNVPLAHPLSYRKYMTEKFFNLLNPVLDFLQENMHFPDSTNPVEYDAEIAAAGGLDFQLLGIGFNGHIAFNEPISAREISVEDFARLPSHLVELDGLTIQTNARLTAGSDLNIVPRKAVTMGMASILKAKEIILLACFPEQTTPLRAIQTGIVTPELPASFLLRHKNTDIIYTEDKIKL